MKGCSTWRALGTAKTVTCVPWVYLGNRDRLDGSYVCPNHKQELSSVYQFIDVLYNLRCVLSSSDNDILKSISLSSLTLTHWVVTSLSPDFIKCLHCTV